jgi:hypothetical protein
LFDLTLSSNKHIITNKQTNKRNTSKNFANVENVKIEELSYEKMGCMNFSSYFKIKSHKKSLEGLLQYLGI